MLGTDCLFGELNFEGSVHTVDKGHWSSTLLSDISNFEFIVVLICTAKELNMALILLLIPHFMLQTEGDQLLKIQGNIQINLCTELDSPQASWARRLCL